jgi:hypothetical protein
MIARFLRRDQREPGASSPGKKQATSRPSNEGASGGVSSRHRGRAIGQRGWNAQPVGKEAGDGGSPKSVIRGRRSVGSVSGAAERSAAV